MCFVFLAWAFHNVEEAKAVSDQLAIGRENQINGKIAIEAIDDLLYSSTNHVAVKEELQQYSDIFKLSATQHEQCCELLGVEDQGHEVGWFDDLDQDVFYFKYNWLRESADKSSSKGSSRGSSRTKKSSGVPSQVIAPCPQQN